MKPRWQVGVPLAGSFSIYGRRYRMRDRVFGWGPIEVLIKDYMVFLLDDPESPGVPCKDISPWIEFKDAPDETTL